MGLFSSKKETYVSTVTYPLGTEGEDQTNYLQAAVMNAILQNRSVSDSITRGYLAGPGRGLFHAYRYARDHYKLGLPASSTYYTDSPDQAVLGDALEALHPGKLIHLVNCMVGFTDYTWWAERYLTVNYGYDLRTQQFRYPPQGVEVTADVSYDINTRGEITIALINADGFITQLKYKPNDMASRKLYVHAAYQTIEAFPTETSSSTRPTEVGDLAGSTTTVNTVNRNGELLETKLVTTLSLASGTTTVTVDKSMRLMSRPQYFLYELGAGDFPDLDAWNNETPAVSAYFPAIPLRINNVDVQDPAANYEEAYESGKKYAKKIGVDLDDLAQKIRENNQIGEIDFAFLMFGVSLNTKTPECRKYLFEFFDRMHTQSVYSKAEFDAWAAEQTPSEP